MQGSNIYKFFKITLIKAQKRNINMKTTNL